MFPELMPFLTKHWLLASSFVVVLVLYIWHEVLYRQQAETIRFTPEQLVLQMNHDMVHLIDIRSNDAHQASAIIGAQHIDADQLPKKLASLHKKSNDKVLVLIGENGHDAATLTEKLKTPELPLRYLAGGMQAWREAQLPTTKPSKSK